MSTRCCLIVSDERTNITIYRHCDGYPESVIPDLAQVVPYVWTFPRFEASDFSAGIVAAWKSRGGGIYCYGSTESDDLYAACPGDLSYVYLVTMPDGAKSPQVVIQRVTGVDRETDELILETIEAVHPFEPESV